LIGLEHFKIDWPGPSRVALEARQFAWLDSADERAPEFASGRVGL
jgi:hypothetical protein